MVLFLQDKGFIKSTTKIGTPIDSNVENLSSTEVFHTVYNETKEYLKDYNHNKLKQQSLDSLFKFIFQIDLPITLPNIDAGQVVFDKVINKFYPFIPNSTFESPDSEDRVLNVPLYPTWFENKEKLHSNLPLKPITSGIHRFEVALSRTSLLLGWSCCYTFHDVNSIDLSQNYEYIIAHVEKIAPMDTLYMSGEVVSCQINVEKNEITTWTENYRSNQKITIPPSAVPPGAIIFFIPIVMLSQSKCYVNFGSMPFSLPNTIEVGSPVYQMNTSRIDYYKYIYSCLYRLLKLRTLGDFTDYNNLLKIILDKIISPTMNHYCISKFFYPIVEDLVVNSSLSFSSVFQTIISYLESNGEIGDEFLRVLQSRVWFLKRTKTNSMSLYTLLVIKHLLSIGKCRDILFSSPQLFDILEIIFAQRPLLFLEFLQKRTTSVSSNVENKFIFRKKSERDIQFEIFKILIEDKTSVNYVSTEMVLKWIRYCVDNCINYSKRVAQNIVAEQAEFTTLNNLFFIITQYLDLYLSDIRNAKSFPISIFYFGSPQRPRVGGVFTYLEKTIRIEEYDAIGAPPTLNLHQDLYLLSIDILQFSFCTYLSLIDKLDAASRIEKRELERAIDYSDYQKLKTNQEATQLKADYLRNEMLEKTEHYEYLWKHLSFSTTLITEVIDKDIFEYLNDNVILSSLSVFSFLLEWNAKSTFQNYNFQTTNNILSLVLKKHGSIVDREISKSTSDIVCEFLKRGVFHPIISYHPDFHHFIHMLLKGLTDMDVDLLTFLCTRRFDTFLNYFKVICLENPNCLLKLLNVIFSNVSEHISAKHEIPLRLKMFNYLCRNLPHLITENETSLLITGQFIMYIIDKLSLQPNSKDNVYHIAFSNLLPSIYHLNKNSKEDQSLKQTITKVNSSIIPVIQDIPCNSDFPFSKKTDLINFFQSIIDEQKKSLNSSFGSSSENLCNICYTYDANVVFQPCGHSSCQHCVTRQKLVKNICFFCREEIVSTIKKPTAS